MNPEMIPVCGNMERVREIWETLESGDNTSYFLSWGWIENWLASLPDPVKPFLMVFREGNAPQIAFFLGSMKLGGIPFFPDRERSGGERKNRITDALFCGRHLFRRRGWFLNATGDPAFDRVHIEYNGFLFKQGESFRFYDVLKNLPDAWDEIYLQGLDTRCFPEAETLHSFHPYQTVVDREMSAPFVDLNRIRERGCDYLAFLSANTRGQIRKSYRSCREFPVRLEVARDLPCALDIYDELVAMHEKVWTRRCGGGAFSTEYLYLFHKNLIRKRFVHDEIQMLRIRCGGETAGCLYNLVYRNNVYFYQSGINYSLDQRLKPGYLSHVEAILYNVAAGHKTYDFMCGGERYKTSLATHHNRLIWMRVQKPLFKFRVERVLKHLNRKLRSKKIFNSLNQG